MGGRNLGRRDDGGRIPTTFRQRVDALVREGMARDVAEAHIREIMMEENDLVVVELTKKGLRRVKPRG